MNAQFTAYPRLNHRYLQFLFNTQTTHVGLISTGGSSLRQSFLSQPVFGEPHQHGIFRLNPSNLDVFEAAPVIASSDVYTSEILLANGPHSEPGNPTLNR
ncbi:hypothetical protein LSAT2_006816 [Lamellibrachia satsuma]|nr:hypothetical protein LSAT2_006816 [Lamellibrachia satsuma]